MVQSNKSGGFIVNEQHYKRSIVVSADKIIDDWSPQYFDDLKISDFQRLAEFDAEIVILGTGKNTAHANGRTSATDPTAKMRI